MAGFLLQVAHVDVDRHAYVVVIFGLECDPVVLHTQHRVQLEGGDHLLDLLLQRRMLVC